MAQARAFRDEVKDRADRQLWVCPNERYRLMYVGAGLWQNLEFFTEFEERYGAVFVRSNYLSIASDGYLRYGTRDPLRCLASRYTALSEQMHIPGLGGAWAIWEAKRHRIDGGLSLGGWWGQRIINVALEEKRHSGARLPGRPRRCQHVGRREDARAGERVHRDAPGPCPHALDLIQRWHDHGHRADSY